MTRPALALSLLIAAGSALAASGWSSYATAFPLLPCADGWAACKVSGGVLTPDLVADSAGNRQPADLRIGWFDLAPTAAFSPFVSLSVYDGPPEAAAEEPAVAEVDPEAAKAQAEADEARKQAEAASAATNAAKAEADQAVAERKKAEEDAKRAAQERAAADAKMKSEAEAARKAAEAASKASAADKARLEAQAKAAEEARKKAEAEAAAKAAEQARLEAERKAKEAAAKKAADEAAKRAAEEAAKKAAEESAKKAADEAAKKAAEEAAKRAADEAARKAAADEAAKKAAEANAAAGGGDAVADAAAVAPADCSSLQELEPMAMLGKLTDGQMVCLQGRIESEAKQTDKEKVSRVMMANTWAKGDKKAWEKLAKYHLEELGSSDPDLCYKYALRLAAGGAARAPGVIHWADVAMENRTVWTGDEYVQRVYALYKMKAAAAQTMWKAAEAEHAAAPTDATSKKVETTRNQTKVFAREWYEYAVQSGRDKVPAQQLCMSAAGTADYCEGG